MGSNYSSLLTKEEAQSIADETGFTPAQVKRLYNRFTSLDKDNTGYLNKQDFSRIPELHVNPLRDRIIDVLLDDYGQEGQMNFKQFARVFAIFRRSNKSSSSSSSSSPSSVSGGGGAAANGGGTLGNDDETGAKVSLNCKENKLKFIFSLYDRDGDDRINKSELLAILSMLVGDNLPDEQMNAIAERTIAELATSDDGTNAANNSSNNAASGSGSNGGGGKDLLMSPPSAASFTTISFKKFCDTLLKIDIEDKMSMKFLA